ncbi:MAG: EamA family transporter [Saprospiraceae bacterium]|nr:EamA family transporter [Saprospiraceae bacterium]
MEPWLLFAILSMIFAGVTAIFAKIGMENISADPGLAIRTAMIFFLVMITGWWGKVFTNMPDMGRKQWIFLFASGLTAFLSWLFYFRALKDGPVTSVASIDKASIIVTLFPGFLIFKEPMKPQILVGGGLILVGMLVLVWK